MQVNISSYLLLELLEELRNLKLKWYSFSLLFAVINLVYDINHIHNHIQVAFRKWQILNFMNDYVPFPRLMYWNGTNKCF